MESGSVSLVSAFVSATGIFSSEKNIKVYNDINDTKYKYFYFKVNTTNTNAGIAIFNLKFSQYPQNDTFILDNDIYIDITKKQMIVNVKNEFIDEDPMSIALLYCNAKYVYAFSDPNNEDSV